MSSSSSSSANVVDIQKYKSNLETKEKLDRAVSSKKITKQADKMIFEEMEKASPSTFKLGRMKGGGGKGRGRKGKAAVLDLNRLTVNDYTYEEFSKSINTVLPSFINYMSFNDERFLSKLKSSKDIKHSLDNIVVFPITNDYLGLGAAVLGCGLEFYAEKTMAIEAQAKRESKGKQKETHSSPELAQALRAIPTESRAAALADCLYAEIQENS